MVKVLVGLVRQYGYRRASKDIKDFLTGYEKYIKLSYEEWLCMPDVYLYTLSRDVAGLNKGRYDFSEAYLKERIQLHAFLYREYEGFRDFIRSLYF